MHWLVHVSLWEGPGWCKQQVHCAKQLRAVKVKASINRPTKPHILDRKISIFLLIWSFNNNNNIPKKKKRVKSIRCQQESWVSAVCVCTGEEGIGCSNRKGGALAGRIFRQPGF